MRLVTLLLICLLLPACAGKSPREGDEWIDKTGRISAREIVNLDEAGSKNKVKTSVHASVSSGGGLSIGLGFLLSPLFSGNAEQEAVRYEVDLLDGETMTIYHESRRFEVGDCVRISIKPKAEDEPPKMERVKGAC